MKYVIRVHYTENNEPKMIGLIVNKAIQNDLLLFRNDSNILKTIIAVIGAYIGGFQGIGNIEFFENDKKIYDLIY